MDFQGLYAISDETLTPYDILKEQLKSAIEGGIKIFQLRDKHSSDAKLLPIVQELNALCKQHHIAFFLNDRLELAIKAQVFGVHLGKDDAQITEAKKHFKGKIGISCYDSLERAKKAQDLGASYVAFGACFNSPSKPSAPTINLELLKNARESLKIPICAIGGITLPLLKTHHSLKYAHMLAFISDLWGLKGLRTLDEITSHAKKLNQAFNNITRF
ncbi:thiamine phosphate synthase [Helicobacter cetorum]|uniref:thiamine phosphate synthase n=1 Tax=Helicobacter cetorum TaxID=138563 RepID=UPI000CF17ABC|nr:thiamine phosphate synthase [Helicobacter cetorum]